MDLPRKHHHRITFASALSMPEYAQLTLAAFTVRHRLNGAVDAQELMVAGQYFPGLTGGVIEDNEILK